MSEKHREPEVPGEESPSGRMSRWPCKDHLKGTCTNSFCEKWHPPKCLFYKTKSGCRFGKSAHTHTVRLMNNLVKGPKKNDDKSAVAMLKKNDLHDRIWQPVINRDESHDRSVQPVVKRDTRHELKHRPVGRKRQSSDARQLGWYFRT